MSQSKSTIVRPALRPPRGTLPLRAVFGVLEHAAPELAVRIATRLWFRLPAPPSVHERRARTPEDGRAIRVRNGDLDLRGRIYGPDGAPTAFLVHGWGGWWQQFSAHVEPLLAAGYQVVGYDGPSHGDSGPGGHGSRTTRVMELADAYRAMAGAYGPADLTLAHSMGAMAVLWAAGRGTPTGSLAFIAAATSVDPMVDWFSRVTGTGAHTRAGMVAAVEHAIGYPMAAFEAQTLATRAYRSELRPRLLVVHDTTDRSSPAAGSLRLVRAWPGAVQYITEGLGHRRVLSDTGVVVRVAAFAQASAGGPAMAQRTNRAT